MFLNITEFVARERSEYLIREAAHRQFVNSIRPQSTLPSRAGSRFTLWLGGRLVAWGVWLQGGRTYEPAQVVPARIIDGGG